MTDKEKFRKEIKKLKSNLIHGACSSQVAMETRCKEEAYNEVLAILDTMQEEPVSEFLNTESMIESYKQRLISQANGVKNSPLIDMCLASYKHGINETLDTLNLSNIERTAKNWKEPASGLDNGDMPIERWKQAVEAASNQRNYRSIKGLTETRDDYFVDGVQWADEHPKKEPVSEELEEASKEWLRPQLDKSYAEYGEVKMMELTHFDGYAMLDAIEFGANWQKEHLMKDAVDGEIGYWNLRWLSVNADLPRTVEEGDKVKVILIKEK